MRRAVTPEFFHFMHIKLLSDRLRLTSASCNLVLKSNKNLIKDAVLTLQFCILSVFGVLG